MSLEVIVSNEQDAHLVDEESVAALATLALGHEGITGPAELTVRFVDEVVISELHTRFLGEPGPTDVLSFPIEDDPRGSSATDGPPVLLGDVVICPEVVARNAPEHAGTYEDEIALLLVHGVLHLLGMDHEIDDEAEEMEQRERTILLLARRKGEHTS